MVTIQIWTNRLLKEFDGIEARLPAGMTLSSHAMDPEAGVCKACFDAALPTVGRSDEAASADSADADKTDDGGGADNDAPRVSEDGGVDDEAQKEDGSADHAASKEGKIDGEPPASHTEGTGDATGESLHFKIEMDLGLDTRYPFESPVIRVLEGEDVIPSSMLSDDLITMPGSDAWTPSSTVVGTLQDIAASIFHAKEAGLPTGQGDESGALERGDLRPGALVPTDALDGSLFPCTASANAPTFAGAIMPQRSRRPLDRYVGVTDMQVLELEAHRTRMNQAVVISAISLTTLKKLKFRRGASITLVLKNDENKEFLTPQSHECVVAVTERLQQMGIAGHQTTAGAERKVDQAMSLMAALEAEEAKIEMEGYASLPLVQECMDLFRQAAELYSAANDPRHEAVLTQTHQFLQRPEVIAALEGSGHNNDASDVARNPAPSTAPETPVPGGELQVETAESGGDGATMGDDVDALEKMLQPATDAASTARAVAKAEAAAVAASVASSIGAVSSPSAAETPSDALKPDERDAESEDASRSLPPGSELKSTPGKKNASGVASGGTGAGIPGGVDAASRRTSKATPRGTPKAAGASPRQAVTGARQDGGRGSASKARRDGKASPTDSSSSARKDASAGTASSAKGSRTEAGPTRGRGRGRGGRGGPGRGAKPASTGSS